MSKEREASKDLWLLVVLSALPPQHQHPFNDPNVEREEWKEGAKNRGAPPGLTPRVPGPSTSDPVPTG